MLRCDLVEARTQQPRDLLGALAAAQETGFPPKVPPSPPGSTESIRSALPVTAASGKPPPSVFPETIRSGSTSKCEIAQTGPVRPQPDCTSSAT